jgi:hypothetical protein
MVQHIIGFAILPVYLFIVHPLVSFLFSKKLIANGRYRFLQSVLCPAVFVLAYVIAFENGFPEFLYPIILFAWCELWSLLGVARKKASDVGFLIYIFFAVLIVSVVVCNLFF